MKVTATSIQPPKQFHPIQLTITFETKEEADRFGAVFNDSNIRTFIRNSKTVLGEPNEPCALIRDALVKQGAGPYFSTNELNALLT